MRQQEELQYWENRTYIDGNAARELQELRSAQTHQEYVQRQEEDREAKRHKRQVRAATQRNKERALQISPGYVLFLAATMILMGVVFGCYLQLQSDLNKRVQHVAALETELLNLQNDNDAQQKKINNSVDLENIRQKAMNELGMVYPAEEQIEYFEVDNDDYMNQYENIPER